MKFSGWTVVRRRAAETLGAAVAFLKKVFSRLSNQHVGNSEQVAGTVPGESESANAKLLGRARAGLLRLWGDQATWILTAALGTVGILLIVLLQVSFLMTASAAPEQARNDAPRKAQEALPEETSSSVALANEDVVSNTESETNSEFRVAEWTDSDWERKSTKEIETSEPQTLEDETENTSQAKPNPFESLDFEQPETKEEVSETTEEAQDVEQPVGPFFEEPDGNVPEPNDVGAGVEMDLDVKVQRVSVESSPAAGNHREDKVPEMFIVTSEEQDTGHKTRDVAVVDIVGDAWSVTRSRQQRKDAETVAETVLISLSLEAQASTRVAKAKLSLKVSGPKKISVGDEYRVRFRVTNRANVESEVVSISADLPEGLFHPKGPALIYKVGRLRAGETSDVLMTVRAKRAGVVTHRAALIATGKVFEPTATRVEIVGRTIRAKRVGAGVPRSSCRDRRISVLER